MTPQRAARILETAPSRLETLRARQDHATALLLSALGTAPRLVIPGYIVERTADAVTIKPTSSLPNGWHQLTAEEIE